MQVAGSNLRGFNPNIKFTAQNTINNRRPRVIKALGHHIIKRPDLVMDTFYVICAGGVLMKVDKILGVLRDMLIP